jgi:hypothetical protein
MTQYFLELGAKVLLPDLENQIPHQNWKKETEAFCLYNVMYVIMKK